MNAEVTEPIPGNIEYCMPQQCQIGEEGLKGS